MNGNDSCAVCSMKGKCANMYSEPSSNGRKIQSWNDLLTMQPRCPLELIAWAQVTGLTAQFSLSSSFLITSGSWQTTQFSISSIAPACSATGTDSGEQVADADQWNFQHLTANAGDTLVAPPVRKIIFLRGGIQWKNQMTIDITGGGTYHDLQLKRDCCYEGKVQFRSYRCNLFPCSLCWEDEGVPSDRGWEQVGSEEIPFTTCDNSTGIFEGFGGCEELFRLPGGNPVGVHELNAGETSSLQNEQSNDLIRVNPSPNSNYRDEDKTIMRNNDSGFEPFEHKSGFFDRGTYQVLFFVIICGLISSCGITTPDPTLGPMSYMVVGVCMDSVTSEVLRFDRVIEAYSDDRESMFVVKDTLQYVSGLIRKIDERSSKFAFFYYHDTKPNYEYFYAYKSGFKIWKFNPHRDTVYPHSTNLDSLCIRLVRK